MNDTQMTFGQAVRAKRIRQKLSQQQLAELVGTSREYINMVEKGHRPGGREFRRRVIRVLRGQPARPEHRPGCRELLARTCPIPIECEHGYDCCPKCDPCTCGEVTQ